MSRIGSWLRTFGWEPRRTLQALRGLGRYRSDRHRFRAALDPSFAWGEDCPVIGDWDDSSGSLGAYFHQDLIVARWIRDAAPRRHVDVGSRIDGFVAHLAVIREVEVLDIRPQPVRIPGVTFHQLDLMEELPPAWVSATDSLSCLHTIEHFGLGRYGDAIDPRGHERGIRQLQRMVEPGGMLYLSTPMGPQRVEFNAHRVFSARTILGWFADGWRIERFASIDDRDVPHEWENRTEDQVANDFGCRLGVGIVAARKLPAAGGQGT